MVREFNIDLWQADFGEWHQAGVIGLARLLCYLGSDNSKVLWEMCESSILMRWHCSDREALIYLLAEAYGINNTDLVGSINIPARKDSTLEKLITHNGLLNTLLQHPTAYRKTEDADKELLCEENLKFSYKAIERYNYQDLNPYKKCGLFDECGNFLNKVKITQWLLPGATEKHVAIAQHKTRISESIEGFISLLFTPLSVEFYAIKSKCSSSLNAWAILLPKANNLQCLPLKTTHKNALDYYCCCEEEAVLDYLSRHKNVDEVFCCTFSNVAWSKQKQINSRVKYRRKSCLLKLYNDISYFHNSKQRKSKKEVEYVSTSFAKELFVKAIFYNLPLLYGLYDAIHYFDSPYFQELYFENIYDTFEYLVSKKEVENYLISFTDVFHWNYFKKRSYLRKWQYTKTPSYDKLKMDLIYEIKRCKNRDDFLVFFEKYFDKHKKETAKLLPEDKASYLSWCKNNWRYCLAATIVILIDYRNPWKTPRLRRKLEKNNIKPPKSIISQYESTLIR